MVTIKSFTNLQQSKKLAEILPLESADMVIWGKDLDSIAATDAQKFMSGLKDRKMNYLPCWSLASLLSILPNEIITDNRFECHYQIDIRKYDGGDNTTLYQIAYGNDRGSNGSWHDMINTGEKENLIDCCVQMILELNKLKML